MDILIPVQQIIKFHNIASRIQNLQKQVVQLQVLSKQLINIQSPLSSGHTELIYQILQKVFKLYAPQANIVTTDELLEGPQSYQFFPIVMQIATKQTLLDASKNILSKSNEHVEEQAKALKNITQASQSMVPAVVEAIASHFKQTDIYSDYNYQIDQKQMHNHFSVSSFKQKPRNIPEETVGFTLVGDTLDQITKKINKGFCEDKNIEYNPVLDNYKIVFCFLPEVEINQKKYTNVQNISTDFVAGIIDPKALKEVLTSSYKQFWKEDAELTQLCIELVKKK